MGGLCLGSFYHAGARPVPADPKHGAVEGLNNKLKVIVRRSYGFRSYDVTTTALYHGMGNLPEPHFPHRFC